MNFDKLVLIRCSKLLINYCNFCAYLANISVICQMYPDQTSEAKMDNKAHEGYLQRDSLALLKKEDRKEKTRKEEGRKREKQNLLLFC